ncbi:MAG TPA: tetratricopeptide repeat protein [Polyangiaceae bacterium]
MASSPLASSPVASSPRGAPPPAPPPISTRERLPSYDDLPDVHAPEPERRARSRWIAGVVFLAVAGLLAVTVGRQYLARFSTSKKPELVARDERAARFLSEGNRMLDRADYDGAQELITKAQALADREPSVLAARARLDTLRADLAWLKLRLLDPATTALVQETQRELGRLAGKSRAAVEAAFAVAPEDPSVVRARVDSLRVAGEEGKAREWIAPIAAHASDPQNAYVLAALDLAEATPVWSTVVDRLRAAAVSEHEAARARGALVYALVRAGRVVEAETELSKIASTQPPHPLLEELKGFVSRFSSTLDAGVDAARDAAAAAGTGEALRAPVAPVTGGAVPEPPGGDFRARLRQASEALSSGNLSRAQELYQSVTSELPGNTEALAGLADVARRRGDTATATRLYDQVLAANPSYLPALMASADTKWQSGDRKGALTLYRRVLEHAGPSTDYGQRAAARIAEGEGSGAQPSPAAPAARPSPSSAPPTPTSDTPTPPSKPEIDTSDLPGVTPP